MKITIVDEFNYVYDDYEHDLNYCGIKNVLAGIMDFCDKLDIQFVSHAEKKLLHFKIPEQSFEIEEKYEPVLLTSIMGLFAYNYADGKISQKFNWI